ncbi:hypothetical protein BC826DRAFT_967081 [Russula brevipes]|nr:hypothetical protein BC826DRAFT_967081 [Russula brevipes]
MTRCPPLLSPPLSLPPAAPPPLGPPPAAADQTFEVPPKPPPLQDNERWEPRSIICASFTAGTMRAELPGREKPRQGLADDLCALRGECAARTEQPNASTPRHDDVAAACMTCAECVARTERPNASTSRRTKNAWRSQGATTTSRRHAIGAECAARAERPNASTLRGTKNARSSQGAATTTSRRPARSQTTKREHIAAGMKLPESQHITATCAICAEAPHAI